MAFNPAAQMKLCADVQDCLFGDYPTLSHVKVCYGDNAPKMWLIPQLYNLSEYCGVKDKLQGTALEETAFVIATEYFYLKVTELMLFFHRFKSGRYGRFYGNVDPLVITTSIREFIHERNHEIDNHEQMQRKLQYDEELKQAVTREEYEQMIQK